MPEEKLEEKLGKDVLKNISTNMRVVNHVEIAVGGVYKLTAEDKKDELLMAKVNHAVKLGVLKRGQ